MKAGYARRSISQRLPLEPERSMTESDFILDADEPDPESDETEARELLLNSFGRDATLD